MCLGLAKLLGACMFKMLGTCLHELLIAHLAKLLRALASCKIAPVCSQESSAASYHAVGALDTGS